MTDKAKNRYIIAMEIGNENEGNGVTYHELVKELEKRRGEPLTKYGECTFMQWFLENYSTPSKPKDINLMYRYKYCIEYVKQKHGENFADEIKSSISKYKKNVLDIKTFLNGDASKKYIDYLELVEARQSSKKAIKKANTSIWIAIITMFISIVFSIWNINTQPKPPLEVKVINQPVQNNK